jgi:hypothetical protein
MTAKQQVWRAPRLKGSNRHCEGRSPEATSIAKALRRRLGLASMLAQRRLRPTCDTRLVLFATSSFAISSLKAFAFNGCGEVITLLRNVSLPPITENKVFSDCP